MPDTLLKTDFYQQFGNGEDILNCFSKKFSESTTYEKFLFDSWGEYYDKEK